MDATPAYPSALLLPGLGPRMNTSYIDYLGVKFLPSAYESDDMC